MPIYLDNNATTCLDPRVKQVMDEVYDSGPLNPSSVHQYGQRAKNYVAKARRTVAGLLGVRSSEIVFTSGGTESANMAIRGGVGSTNGHIITSKVEHSAVYATCQALEEQGYTVTYLDPGSWGAVTPDQVAQAIGPKTQMIALMWANNETGVKTDIDAIGRIASDRQIPFVVDGVAICGKEPIVVPQGVSSLCLSGHKFHGPAGIGICMVRRLFRFSPLLVGGGQESGRRGGTENIAGIVGVAKALELAFENGAETKRHVSALRDAFEKSVVIPGRVEINGDGPRVCNTSNLAFLGLDGESILMRLDLAGLAASHGSACSSGALEPSRVLTGMGYSKERAGSSVRFSLSRMTSFEEIDEAIRLVNSLHS